MTKLLLWNSHVVAILLIFVAIALAIVLQSLLSFLVLLIFGILAVGIWKGKRWGYVGGMIVHILATVGILFLVWAIFRVGFLFLFAPSLFVILPLLSIFVSIVTIFTVPSLLYLFLKAYGKDKKPWILIFQFSLFLIIVSGLTFPYIQRQIHINEQIQKSDEERQKFRESFLITDPTVPPGWQSSPYSFGTKTSQTNLYFVYEKSNGARLSIEIQKKQNSEDNAVMIVSCGVHAESIAIEESINTSKINGVFSARLPQNDNYEGYKKYLCWQTEYYRGTIQCNRNGGLSVDCGLSKDELVRVAESINSTE